MNFRETSIAGVWTIEIEPQSDERGFFARTWDAAAFTKHGLVADFTQTSISFNAKAGTLRGMHMQEAPHAERKIVRCSAGAAYDVVLDVRENSPTYGRWLSFELTSRNNTMLFIPEGCAHGFLTLEDATEISYQIAGEYAPASARGIRWNDPAFGIAWPRDIAVISDRDRSYPDAGVRA